MKKYLQRLVLNLEARNSFNPRWYSIIFNPFYITRKILMTRIKEFANTLDKDLKILDVGCGSKPYKFLFNTDNFIGIDVRSGGLADKSKSADMYFDGENIPFPDKEFDVVIATEVFEHVKNLSKLTKEIYRVLKNGGTFMTTMPFVWPEHEQPYDFRRFTSFGHRKNLEKNNFRDIKIRPTTGIFGTCGQIISDFIAVGSFYMMENWLSSEGFRYKLKFVAERLFVVIFCFPVQLLFLTLDIIFRRKGITLDYMAVAKK